MSKRNNPNGQYRQISFSVDPDLARQIDQVQIDFGMDNRGDVMRMIVRTYLSMTPLETTVHEVAQAAVRSHREAEIAALVKHYEDRARMLREGRL